MPKDKFELNDFLEKVESISKMSEGLSDRIDSEIEKEAEKLARKWIEEDVGLFLCIAEDTFPFIRIVDNTEAEGVETELHTLFQSVLSDTEVYTTADFQFFGEFLADWARKFKEKVGKDGEKKD